MSEPEEWRPWRDGAYEVSNLGRVRRAKPGRRTAVGRALRAYVGGAGYLYVSPVVAGRNRPTTVHSMVAECFLGARNGLDVNHLDGNKTNARASNLEYVTHRANMQHARATGLTKVGEEHGHAKLSNAQVAEIRDRRSRGEGVSALAREYGVSPGHVCWIAKGKSRRAG